MKGLGITLVVLGALAVGGCEGAEGPEGPTGPTGPTGPAGDMGDMGDMGDPGVEGADGADGADGVSGYELVEADCIAMLKFGNSFQRVFCPNGKMAMSGGVGVYSDAACTVPSGVAQLTYSGLEGGQTDHWVGDAFNFDVEAYFQTHVICATVN